MATGESTAVNHIDGFERAGDALVDGVKKVGLRLVGEMVPFGSHIPAVRRQLEEDAAAQRQEWYDSLTPERRARFDAYVAEDGAVLKAAGQQRRELMTMFPDMPGGPGEKLEGAAMTAATMPGSLRLYQTLSLVPVEPKYPHYWGIPINYETGGLRGSIYDEVIIREPQVVRLNRRTQGDREMYPDLGERTIANLMRLKEDELNVKKYGPDRTTWPREWERKPDIGPADQLYLDKLRKMGEEHGWYAWLNDDRDVKLLKDIVKYEMSQSKQVRNRRPRHTYEGLHTPTHYMDPTNGQDPGPFGWGPDGKPMTLKQFREQLGGRESLAPITRNPDGSYREDAKGGDASRAAEKSQDYTAHEESTAATEEQIQEAIEFLHTVLEIGAPQNEWEQSAVQRIIDRLEAGLKATGGTAEPPQDPDSGDPRQAQGDVGGGYTDDDIERAKSFDREFDEIAATPNLNMAAEGSPSEYDDGKIRVAGTAGYLMRSGDDGTYAHYNDDGSYIGDYTGVKDLSKGLPGSHSNAWVAGDRVDIGKGMYLTKGEKEGTGTVFGAGDDSKMADVTDFEQGAFEDGGGSWFSWTDSLTGLDKTYSYDGDGNAKSRETANYGEYRPGGGDGYRVNTYNADGTRRVAKSINKADGGRTHIRVTYAAGGNTPTDIWGGTSPGEAVHLDKDDFNGKPVSLENTASAIEQHGARRSAEGIGKARDYGDLPGMQKPSHPAAPDDITAQFQAQYDGSKGDAGDLANPPQPGTGSAPEVKTDKVEPKDVAGNDTVEVFGNGFGQAATGTVSNEGLEGLTEVFENGFGEPATGFDAGGGFSGEPGDAGVQAGQPSPVAAGRPAVAAVGNKRAQAKGIHKDGKNYVDANGRRIGFSSYSWYGLS